MPRAAAAAAAVAVAAKYVAMHAVPIPVVDIIRAHGAIGVKIDPLTAILPFPFPTRISIRFSRFYRYISQLSSARLEDYRFTSCTMFRVEVIFRSD